MLEGIAFNTKFTDLSDHRPLLVLDVDETLLHASDAPAKQTADFQVGPYSVWRRPPLQDFLEACAAEFQLAVWSSSTADYLHAVLDQAVLPSAEFVFVWSRERCVRRFDPEWQEHYFVKDLRKVKRLGFDLARVLIVDDTPKKLERNYGNAVYVKPYFGGAEDKKLVPLARYLQTLASVSDVRPIEKRGWRHSVSGESEK
ncbi:MAG: HAD family hydrolase [Planctomycetota bacterium]